MEDLDIYRAAQELIKQYGEEALLKSMKRTEGFRSQGDNEGAYHWNRISDAIEFLTLPPDLTSDQMQ